MHNPNVVKTFRWLVFAAFCSSVLAQSPPSIYIQPQDQAVAVGYPVFLAVGITNSSPPYAAVQWRKASQPIPNATNSNFSPAPTHSGPGYATPSFYFVSYSLTNAQPTNAGTYSVVLSNSVDVVTSLVATVTVIPAATFITMAGSKIGTNDGMGTAAAFSYPRHVALDAAGNIYVTDYGNHTVRKITPAGMVSTVAGMPGVAGTNDGYGSDARFINPHGIAVDRSDNLFVTDLGLGQTNGAIRKISPDGLATTIAGSMTVSGTNDGLGGIALFYSPWGIAVDDEDNLFVSDTLNHTLRKLSPDGTNWEVSTIAGLPGSASLTDGTNSDAHFLYPDGLAVDKAHNLIVADETQIGGGNGAIRKITPVGTNWVVSSIVGPTTFNYLSAPSAVAVNTNGCLYVADQHNHSIRKIIPDGTNWIVATIADFSKTGIKNPNSLPHGIALDQQGNLYVVDYGVNLVLKGWSSDSPANCILNPPQISDGQVQLGVLVQTGSPTNFTLLQADQINSPWTTNSSWLMTTNIPGLNYRMTTPVDGSPFRFYRLQY